MMITHVITYYFAGVIAQGFLGAGAFYPPSETALCYLKDPHIPDLQLLIVPGQLLRGLLFGLVLFPVLSQLTKLGKWKGGFLLGGILFVIGYIAASGGMIEHLIFFTKEAYPLTFVQITFVEILIQMIAFSLLFMWFYRKEFAKK